MCFQNYGNMRLPCPTLEQLLFSAGAPCVLRLRSSLKRTPGVSANGSTPSTIPPSMKARCAWLTGYFSCASSGGSSMSFPFWSVPGPVLRATSTDRTDLEMGAQQVATKTGGAETRIVTPFSILKSSSDAFGWAILTILGTGWICRWKGTDIPNTLLK